MAGVAFKGVGNLSVSGGADKTVLQLIAAANHAVLLKEFTISFDGVSNTATPIKVQVCRQTTAIGGSPTAVTLRKDPDSSAETVQTTAATSAGGSEPTKGDVLMELFVHPQTGYTWQAPFGGDIRVAGGGRLGFVANNGGTAVNCSVSVRGEE